MRARKTAAKPSAQGVQQVVSPELDASAEQKKSTRRKMLLIGAAIVVATALLPAVHYKLITSQHAAMVLLPLLFAVRILAS